MRGEEGGEGSASAFWMTSSGGRARGEMMMHGAAAGLEGRCDQMTYSEGVVAIIFNEMEDEEGEGRSEGAGRRGVEGGGDGDERDWSTSAVGSAGAGSGVGVGGASAWWGESGESMESCFGRGDKGCWGCQAEW